MASAVQALQKLRAIHLYRRGLKNMLSWAVRREVFYAEVSLTRGWGARRSCWWGRGSPAGTNAAAAASHPPPAHPPAPPRSKLASGGSLSSSGTWTPPSR